MGKLNTFITRLKQTLTKIGEDVKDLRVNKANVSDIPDTPNLQQVTDIGSATTKTVEFGNGSGTLHRKSYYLGSYSSSNFVIRFPEITANTRSVIKINASQNVFNNSVRPQELLLNIKTGSFRVLSQSNYQNANVYYWTEGGHHYIYFQLLSAWHNVYAEVMSSSNNTIIPELVPFSSGMLANAVQADHCRLAMFEEIPSLTGYATEIWVDNKLETIELTPGPQGEQGVPGTNGQDGANGQDGTDGKTWHSGTSNPSNSLGKVGDWHLNRNTWDVREKTGTSTWTVRGNIKGANGEQGIQGVPGTNGQDGANGQDGTDGKTWHSGTSNPSNSLGKVGDWHLNRTTWDVREKTGTSTWTVRGNIKGADGSTWYNGVSNPTTQGVVGDWYIKTSTWDVYRKISSNSWNHYGNIKGADGVPADVSNKADIDGSNTAGGTWKIDRIGSNTIGVYLAVYTLSNLHINIPTTDALGSADGVLLMRGGSPLVIAENQNPDWDGYIYRAGEPNPGYPDNAKTGNYLIESKHRFRFYQITAPDSTSGNTGLLTIQPYNAIEHSFYRVTFSGLEIAEIDMKPPTFDEITDFPIERNAIGQKCTVAVSGGMAGVQFTNVAGADFTAEWKKGVFTFYWTEAGWLFGGYSPIEP